MTFMLILAKNCHLPVVFSMPLRLLQTFVRSVFRHLFLRLMSPIWCCYVLYRTCSTDPSLNIASLLHQFWALHMILKWDAPKGWESGPRTLCLLLCPFSSVTILRSVFAFFDYCSERPEEPPIDLINFIWDKSCLVIYFYTLLTIFQPTYT